MQLILTWHLYITAEEIIADDFGLPGPSNSATQVQAFQGWTRAPRRQSEL